MLNTEGTRFSQLEFRHTFILLIIYTASKVKHHLNIFLEKTVKLSKYEFILVTCLKRDKVVTIYSIFDSIIIRENDQARKMHTYL